MNTRNMNTTTRLLAAICLALAPAIAIAHGGLEHVMGTVAKVFDTSVIVTTTAGKSVVVNFDAKTTFSRASKPIQKADVQVGDRVVIHAEEIEEGKTYLGRTVEIGAAAKTAAKTPPPAH
jgi:mevalonate pyrophosphate decarboxylase